MAQITIYLPDEIESKVRKAARKNKTSVSKWISAVVQDNLKSNWPPELVAAFGAFPDFPDVQELRKGYGPESPREPFD